MAGPPCGWSARPRRLAAVFLLAAVSFDSAHALWGGVGSEVVDLTLHRDVRRVRQSPYVWAIALYRDGCGYCELLKPEWEAAAGKMRKMAGVAAVDVVTHQHIAKSLMEEYGFEVKGVPTVVVLRPGPDGAKKELEVYNGERKRGPIVKALTAAMPQYVARVTEAAFATWQRKPGAKVLLFSKRREPPAALRALSTKYRDRNVSFGLVDASEVGLRGMFGVNTLPALAAVEAGRRVGEGGYAPAVHKGSTTSFVSMDFFVMDFAAAKPVGSGSDDDDSGASSKGGGGSSSGGGGSKAKASPPPSPSPSRRRSKAKAPPAGSAKKKKAPSPPPPPKAGGGKGSRARKSPALSGKLRKLPQPADPIKLKGTDLTKLTVKQLRGVLARWDDPCTSCLEKSNFIERIERHRTVYGDMEAVAQHYAQRHKRKQRRDAKRSAAATGGGGAGGGGGGGADEGGSDGDGGDSDDPFCSRLLETETAPLRDRIAELEAENSRLKRQLELVSEPLIHDDL